MIYCLKDYITTFFFNEENSLSADRKIGFLESHFLYRFVVSNVFLIFQKKRLTLFYYNFLDLRKLLQSVQKIVEIYISLHVTLIPSRR